MYCKNCGKELDPNAAVCITCGVAKGTGVSFCQNCGESLVPGAAVCVKCGCAVNQVSQSGGAKSKLAAGLLGIFLGYLGVHNFYLGYTGKAVAQLILGIFSCGIISGIWGLIEGIMILTGNIAVDGQGKPLKD